MQRETSKKVKCHLLQELCSPQNPHNHLLLAQNDTKGPLKMNAQLHTPLSTEKKEKVIIFFFPALLWFQPKD